MGVKGLPHCWDLTTLLYSSSAEKTDRTCHAMRVMKVKAKAASRLTWKHERVENKEKHVPCNYIIIKKNYNLILIQKKVLIHILSLSSFRVV